jgi:[ribosomal protein S18]-alanine N-acetyltransferase
VPPSPAIDPTRVRVRRAVAADLDALVALERSAFSGDRMSVRQFRHHLGNPSAEVLVAVPGGGVAGAAIVFFHRRHRIARLYSIAVAKRARGAGIGARLLAAAERAAHRRRSTELRLEVRADNSAARALYEQHGYARIGTRHAYYEDGEDAVRYAKPLVGPPRDAPQHRSRRVTVQRRRGA